MTLVTELFFQVMLMSSIIHSLGNLYIFGASLTKSKYSNPQKMPKSGSKMNGSSSMIVLHSFTVSILFCRFPIIYLWGDLTSNLQTKEVALCCVDMYIILYMDM
jgi:hypothetical protein